MQAASCTPVSTLIPAPLSFSIPVPSTLGKGSLEPMTTFDTICRMIRSVQGGVFPKCEQGSSDTYNVDRGISSLSSSLTALKQFTSACACPYCWCQPSPMILPSKTSTAPTIGLGATFPAPRLASSRHLCMYISCSVNTMVGKLQI